MAAQAPVTARSVPLFVVIIFVVLFLASTTGLILLFVHQEDLRQRTNQAESRFNDYVGRRNLSRLEPFMAMGKNAQPRMTAVGALLADRDRLAQMLGGNPNDTSDQVKEGLKIITDALPAEIPGIRELAEVNVTGALQQLAQAAADLNRQNQQLQQQITQLQQDRDTQTQSLQRLQEAFTEASNEYLQKAQQLADQFEQFRQDMNEQLDAVKTEIAGQLRNRLNDMEKQFTLNLDELRDLVQRNLRLLAPVRRAATAPPAAGKTASLTALATEPDGKVLEVTEDGQVAYIDLGEENRLPTGVMFLVFPAAPIRGTAAAPKGLVEVIRPGATISQCRIITQREDQPIAKGDVVTNLAYSRGKPHSFMVFGEFDLDGDKMPDPDGEARVRRMITSAGAVVQDHLGPTLDFLVVGQAPQEPAKPAADASDEEVALYQAKLERRKQYQQLLDQAGDMGVLVVTQEQFLALMGMPEKLTSLAAAQ